MTAAEEHPDTPEHPDGPGPHLVAHDGPPPRWPAVAVVVSVACYAASLFGAYFGPSLFDHPAALLVVDARDRHLLAAIGGGIGVVAFFAIGFLRIVAPAPFLWAVGRRYGERGLDWFARQTRGDTGFIGALERWFAKAGVLVLILVPSVLAYAVAGTAKMPLRLVLAVISVGVAARLAVFWWLGQQFRPQLEDLVGWIGRYQWWVIGALVLASVIRSSIRQGRAARRRG